MPTEDSDEFPPDPVIGDGVLTLTPMEQTMAADISENVANMIITESAGNIQANNRDGRNIGTVAMGVLQGAMARNFDELGTVEGRANSGVNATPIASPATGA